MIPAAAIAILRDRRLKRRDLLVYSVALERLSFYRPQPLKVGTVAREAHVHISGASRALSRLVAFGYLERGDDDGQRRTYLLRETPLRVA